MRYAIDTVHLDRAGKVVAVQTLQPWRLGIWVWHARSVLELRAGEAAHLGLSAGACPRLIEVQGRVSKKDAVSRSGRST